jgi:hypothetical protein
VATCTLASDLPRVELLLWQWTRGLHAAIDIFDIPNLFNIRTACMGNGYQSQLVIVALGPIVFLCVVMAATVAWKVGLVCRRRSISEFRRLRREFVNDRHSDRISAEQSYYRMRALPMMVQQAAKDGLESSMPLALLVSFVCVTTVSATIFKARSCEGFGDIDDVPEVDRHDERAHHLWAAVGAEGLVFRERCAQPALEYNVVLRVRLAVCCCVSIPSWHGRTSNTSCFAEGNPELTRSTPPFAVLAAVWPIRSCSSRAARPCFGANPPLSHALSLFVRRSSLLIAVPAHASAWSNSSLALLVHHILLIRISFPVIMWQ